MHDAGPQGGAGSTQRWPMTQIKCALLVFWTTAVFVAKSKPEYFSQCKIIDRRILHVQQASVVWMIDSGLVGSTVLIQHIHRSMRPSTTLVGPLWERYHRSRRSSRDTFPASYITKHTSIPRVWNSDIGDPREVIHAGILTVHEQLVYRNVQRFRGGLVFEAQRLLYPSTLGFRE